MCYARFARFSLGTASLRLASITAAAGRNFAGGRAASSVSVGRVYGCKTIGYLLLCIWHIVKLIERDDKIAMFFDVKRGERLARERDGERGSGEKKGEGRGEGEREKELREGGGLPNLRQTERKREMRREVGDSERESHARRERKGERRREPRVCRGAVCDEPEGPVRDHPNSEDPLFSRCPVGVCRSG